MAKDVSEFTPIIIYMGIVGALLLAAQILDLRKEMKKGEGPILRPRLGEMTHSPKCTSSKVVVCSDDEVENKQ